MVTLSRSYCLPTLARERRAPGPAVFGRLEGVRRSTDQYDKISSHTQNGIQFLENFHTFVKERATIESEYADRLRKMARKFQPKKGRQMPVEDDDTNFTTHLAFNAMLNEIADLAGQHETISEALLQSIAKEIASLVRELKDERKRLLAEGSKLQQNLQNCVAQMEKCQRAYSKAHRDAEKMQDKYERAEKDMHLSRAEVEIAKQSAITKNQFCEDAKAEYASQLQKTNELQRMHFNDYMPRVFSDLQQMDERRITCIQSFMKEVAQAQLRVNPIITKCLNEIITAAETVDPVKDSEMVVDKYKSGFYPPEDFPFENLSDERTNGSSLTYGAGSGVSGGGGGGGGAGGGSAGANKDRHTMRGTVSSKTKKGRGLLKGIFGPSNKEETWSELPPNQRRKKIQKKLKDIRDELAHETNQKDGLQKMRRTYEDNPALGDPASLDAENDRCVKSIENLHQQIQKYQSLLNEIESSTPDAVKRHSGHARGNSIISAEDTCSLSRSNSDESNIHNNSGTHLHRKQTNQHHHYPPHANHRPVQHVLPPLNEPSHGPEDGLIIISSSSSNNNINSNNTIRGCNGNNTDQRYNHQGVTHHSEGGGCNEARQPYHVSSGDSGVLLQSNNSSSSNNNSNKHTINNNNNVNNTSSSSSSGCSSSSASGSSHPATPLTPNTPRTPFSPPPPGCLNHALVTNVGIQSPFVDSPIVSTSPDCGVQSAQPAVATATDESSPCCVTVTDGVSGAGITGPVVKLATGPSVGEGVAILSAANCLDPVRHHDIRPAIEEEGGGGNGGGCYTGNSNGDHGAFNSESGVGSGSLRDIDDPDFEDGPTNEVDEEPLPPLGTAVALYPFEAQNEGAISMKENDEMYIVEVDQGDGWTRVRMRHDRDEGFVPSSYLDVSMYNTC